MREILLAPLILICSVCLGQDMYNALKKQHGQLRFGVGLQALEPTGINVQVFHGYFCSNDDTYATKGIVELGFGSENTVLSTTGEVYRDGIWKKGGLRAELNYLFPVFTLEWAAVFQTYVGAGIQTGSRHYVDALGDQSVTATGGNLILRLEAGGRGFEAGNDLLFLSVYVDAKYHKEFSEDFQYFKPSIGIRIRRAR